MAAPVVWEHAAGELTLDLDRLTRERYWELSGRYSHLQTGEAGGLYLGPVAELLTEGIAETCLQPDARALIEGLPYLAWRNLVDFFFARIREADPKLDAAVRAWLNGVGKLTTHQLELVTAVRAWRELGIPVDRYHDSPLGFVRGCLTAANAMDRHKLDVRAGDAFRQEFADQGAYVHRN